jgi:hypothetical protein
MRVTEIADSKYNHGTPPEIIMTCSVDHEIAFKPEDVVRVLQACWSDSMAKVINAIGREFNKDQMAECYSVSDLDEDGIRFIEDMYYFINGDKK